MAISKKFIELFEGEMWLESDSNGTKVFFTIPFDQVTKPKTKNVNEIEIEKGENRSNKQITLLIKWSRLCVDCHQRNFILLHLILKDK